MVWEMGQLHHGSHPSQCAGSSSALQGTATLWWSPQPGISVQVSVWFWSLMKLSTYVLKKLSFQSRVLNYRIQFSGSQISTLLSHLWIFISKWLPDKSQMTILGEGKSCPRNAYFLFADCNGSLDREHRWRSLYLVRWITPPQTLSFKTSPFIKA